MNWREKISVALARTNLPLVYRPEVIDAIVAAIDAEIEPVGESNGDRIIGTFDNAEDLIAALKSGEHKSTESDEPTLVGEVYSGDSNLFGPYRQVRWKRGEMPPDGTKLYTHPADSAGKDASPFAWATSDGEGNYDLRLYKDNETYRADYISRNGNEYAEWVKPLFERTDNAGKDGAA